MNWVNVPGEKLLEPEVTVVSAIASQQDGALYIIICIEWYYVSQCTEWHNVQHCIGWYHV